MRLRRTGGLGPVFLGKVGGMVFMDDRCGGQFPRLKISTGARFLEISARGMDRGDLQLQSGPGWRPGRSKERNP